MEWHGGHLRLPPSPVSMGTRRHKKSCHLSPLQKVAGSGRPFYTCLEVNLQELYREEAGRLMCIITVERVTREPQSPAR